MIVRNDIHPLIINENYFNDSETSSDEIVKDVESQSSSFNYEFKVSISFEVCLKIQLKTIRQLLSYLYQLFDNTEGIDDFDDSQLDFNNLSEEDKEDLQNYNEWYIDIAFNSSFKNWKQVTKFIQRIFCVNRFNVIEITSLEINDDNDTVVKLVSFANNGSDWWMLSKRVDLCKVYAMLLHKSVDDAYSDARMGDGNDGIQGRLEYLKMAGIKLYESIKFPVMKLTKRADIDNFFKTVRNMQYAQDTALSDFDNQGYNVYSVKNLRDDEFNLIYDETIKHNGYVSLLVTSIDMRGETMICVHGIPSIVTQKGKLKLFHSFTITISERICEEEMKDKKDAMIDEAVELVSLFSESNRLKIEDFFNWFIEEYKDKY